MKTKLFVILIVGFAISCSPQEEKKEEIKENSKEEEEEVGIEGPENEAPEDVPYEEEQPENAVGEEESSKLDESNSSQSKDAGIESIGTGSGSTSGSGAGYGSGNGATPKSKKIEVKKDITVGEEGVR